MTAGDTSARSRRVELATGLGYHLLEWGGDEDSRDHTVIMLHGFLDLSWGWVRAVESSPLAERFHVVAPDFRGHGDSDRVGAGGYYYFMDYVADVASLIEQIGRARVSLVGHSMGGSVAAYVTGTYPERIHRLALLEGLGPPEMTGELPDRARTWIADWRRARAKEPRSYADLAQAAAQLQKNDPLLDGALARWLATHGTAEGPDRRLRYKHDSLHVTRGPYPFRVEVAESFWRRISCPVLLVDGAESNFRARAEEYQGRARNFADARRATIAGAGHMMQRHQPAAVGALVAEFLAAHSP